MSNNKSKQNRKKPAKSGETPFIIRNNSVVLKDTLRNSEIKFYSANLTATWSSVSTTQVTLDLTDAIAVGNTFNTRIGTKIRVVGVSVTGALCGGQTSGVADDPYNSFRMLLCEQDYSSTITNTSPGYVTNCQALNVDKILSAKDLILQSSGSDSTGYVPTSQWVCWPIRTNILVKYASSGHPINSIKLVMVSDSSASPNPGFTNGQWTIAYIDA
jgi:hypothetical protein